MGSGHNFLRVVLDSRQPSFLRKASEELFMEDEVEAFRWVKAHLDGYGILPTAQEASEEGHQLAAPRKASTPQHYLDLLKKRYGYTQVNERHPRLVEAMRNRDTDSIVSILSEMLQEARRATGGVSFSTIKDQYEQVENDYVYARNNPGLRGVATGWETLDRITNGLMGGDLFVIAGRPSMGKSWLLMKMAFAAARAGEKVGLCSMEMSLQQIARRWLGLATKINPNFIRSGEVGTYGEERMFAEIDAEGERPPVQLLSGDMAKSVSAIETMILEFAPTALFIDAAYLLTPSGKKNGYISRWEAISEVIGELKKLALRYDIPIVISVQFNRNQTNRSKKAFDLGDIAGSDSIPQDASIVVGVRDGPSPHERDQRILEVMKNREGDTPEFATNFTFSPVSMDEIPLIQEGDGQANVATEGDDDSDENYVL
jgi:replicative DNA helicase